MVEKINCGNCRYLNKNKKRKEGSKWYRYGCQKHGYIHLFLIEESDLQNGYCGYYKSQEMEQLSLW